VKPSAVDPKSEYGELMQLVRFYGNVRFAALSVFMALTGALLVIVFKSTPPLSPEITTVMETGGALVALIFWVTEESAAYIAIRFMRRAAGLEKTLGYQIFSALPGAPRFPYRPTVVAMRLQYLLTFAFWSWSAWKSA
jgi:hypothetical protein